MYFMLGLPGETLEDVEAIALLLEKILAMARSRQARISDPCFLLLLRAQAAYPAAVGGAGNGAPSWKKKSAFLKSRLKRHKNLDLDFHCSPGAA